MGVKKTNTVVSLVDNNRVRHHNVLGKLSEAKHILICVAFQKISGLNVIRDALESALKQKANVRIIAGTDFYLTDPAALYELHGLSRSYKNCRLMLSGQSRATFHPKLYYWEIGDEATIVIGSANLTRGGMYSNTELSSVTTTKKTSDFAKETRQYFHALTKEASVEKSSDSRIAEYERKHRIYRKRAKEAEKAAEIEASEEVIVNKRRLEKELRAYRGDKESCEAWEVKKRNYTVARTVLRKMASDTWGKKEFAEKYRQLVGSKQGDAAGNKVQLWHSGGLFRSANHVIGQHKKMAKLVHTATEHARRVSVEEMGNHMLGQAKSIKGVGINIITEILNTLSPRKYAVMNGNSTGSLEWLGSWTETTLQKTTLSAKTYARFNKIAKTLSEENEFESLAHFDHFLNYVYWKCV